MLANNAGALFASRQVTAEGLERTFALNHLAPFLLTNLLRDRLAGRARRDHGLRRPQVRAPGPRRPPVRALLRRDARVRHLEAVQHPVYARAGQARARAARQLLSPRRGAHRASARTRTASGRSSPRSAGRSSARPERGARSLVWLALSAGGGALTGEYVQDEKVIARQRPGPGRDARRGSVGAQRRAGGPVRRCAGLTALPTGRRTA